MAFLIIILVIVGIGVLSGLISNAKSSISVRQEKAHLEELRNSRKTHAPSYSIGSLYSAGDSEGMVVAVDETKHHGRYAFFSAKGTKMNIKKALDYLHVSYGIPNYSVESNAKSYNKNSLASIPTIQDLQVLATHIDRFYKLREERRTGGMYGNFPNVRFEDLGVASKILSRTLTPDAKSVYAYDMSAKRMVVMPISDDHMKYDDEDITCGIILIGFF